MLGEVNTLEPSIFERIIPFFSPLHDRQIFLMNKMEAVPNLLSFIKNNQ